MADNVAITAGAGTNIATDDIGGVHYQVVKIGVGADGTAVHWTGEVRTPDIVIEITPTIQAAAYTAGDLIFDSTEIANAALAAGRATTLQTIVMLDKNDQKVAIKLVFANAATDFGTLNSAPDPDDTESGTVVGWTDILDSDYLDLGANAVACCRNVGLEMQPTATSLWVAGICGAVAPTYASTSDLVLKLGFYRS